MYDEGNMCTVAYTVNDKINTIQEDLLTHPNPHKVLFNPLVLRSLYQAVDSTNTENH